MMYQQTPTRRVLVLPTEPSSGSGDQVSNDASSPTNSSTSVNSGVTAQASVLSRASFGTWHTIQPGLAFLNRHISPFAWRLLLIWTKLILVGLSVVSVTITALALYWVVHWLVIPKQLHSFPVYFDYSSTPACAAVSFSNRQWFDTVSSRSTLSPPVLDLPAPSVDYDVTLALDLPTNHYNIGKGPIMVDITLYGMKGTSEPTARSRRPLLLPYRSSILSTLREWMMIVPAILGWNVDEFTVTVPLLEDLNVKVYDSTTFPLLSATVCMNPPLQVYHANLRFHSQLSGIRYLLSTHPILMCALFVVFVLIGFFIFTGLSILWHTLFGGRPSRRRRHGRRGRHRHRDGAGSGSSGGGSSESVGAGSTASARSEISDDQDSSGIRRRPLHLESPED